MVKWEYYTWSQRDSWGCNIEVDEVVLDEIGSDSWELVSVTPNLVYIFKRPKQNPEGESRG